MKNKFPLLVIAAAITNPALAAFYVEDDEIPQRAALATAAHSTPAGYNAPAMPSAQQAKVTHSTFEVIFYPGKPVLGPKGRSQILQQLPELRHADEITVVGYPSHPFAFTLPQQRTHSVKSWLTEQGINPHKIHAYEERELPAGASKDHLVIHATYKQPATQPVSSAFRYHSTRLVNPRQEAPVAPPMIVAAKAEPAKPVINDQVKLVMAQRIVTLAQNKVIDPQDAINMIADLLRATGAAPAGALPSNVQPAAPAVVVEMPRAWSLDAAKSLQENINEWATAAKWEAPNWKTSAPYRVSYNSIVVQHGTFLDALREVSNAVPSLDFQANKTKRTLFVNESVK